MRSTRLRHRLILSSTLGTGLLLAAAPARAQTSLPTPADATNLVGVNTPVLSPDATRLDVGVTANGGMIDWTRFDIPTGNSIHFNDETGGGGSRVAVLNRVVGDGSTIAASTIDGLLKAPANMAVYLVNPAGLTFGPTGVVDVGSLIAGTLDLSRADFTAGLASGSHAFGAGTGGTVQVDAGARLFATGSAAAGLGNLVLLGAKITVGAPVAGGTPARIVARQGADPLVDPIIAPGTDDGEVALVAADDVVVATSAGSPLAITIAKGTAVEGAFKVDGTIAGRNVTLALATRGGITDTLLSIRGEMAATGAALTDRGVVLTADRSAGAVTLAATTPGAIDAAGTIAAAATIGSGRGVTIAAAGAATLGGGITAGGDLVANAGAITLGTTGATVTQAASGRVDLTATTGDIRAAGTLMLSSNRGDIAYDATTPVDRGLYLDAVAGAIDLTGSTLATGTVPADAYAVQIRNDAVNPLGIRGVTLGDVTAFGITVADAGHTPARATTLDVTGGLTLGTATLTGATVTATGAIAATKIDSDDAVSLTSSTAGVTLGALTTRSGNGSIVAATSAAVTGAVDVFGDYLVTGGSVTLGATGTSPTQAAGGAVTITAIDGTLTGASGLMLRAGPTAALTLATTGTTGGDIAVAGTTLTTAGTTDRGAVQIRSRDAGNAVTLGTVDAGSLLGAVGGGAFTTGITRAAAITVGDVTLTGAPALTDATLRLDAGSAALTTGSLSAPTIALNASDMTLGGITGTGAVTLTGSGIFTTGTIAGVSGLTIDRGGSVALGDVTASGDILVGQTPAARPATITTTGTVTTTGSGAVNLIATGAVEIRGAVSAMGTYAVTGGSVTLGTANTAITQAADGTVSVEATAGDVTGRAGLLLRSDRDGAGNTPLTIATSAPGGGRIDFTGAGLQGGAATRSAVRIAPGSAANIVTLGDVTASALQGDIVGGVYADTITRATTLTFGTLDLTTALTATSTAGDIRLGGTTIGAGQGLTLSAANGALVLPATLSAPGSVALTAGAALTMGSVTSTAGTVSVTTNGTALTATTLAGATGLTIAAGSGAVTLGSGTAGTGALSITADTLGNGTGATDLSTSDTMTLTLGGAARLGTLTAGSIGVTAASIDQLTSATAPGSIALTTGGALDFGTVSAGDAVAGTGTASLTAGGALTGTLAGGVGGVTAQGLNATIGRLVSDAGGISLTTTGGDAMLGSAITRTGVTVAATGGAARVTGAVEAGGDYTVSGTGVTLGNGAASILQSANGAVNVTATNGTLAAGGGLTLRANADASGAEALTLATTGTTGGDIAFAGGLQAGPGIAAGSALTVRSRSIANAVMLGDIVAQRLTGAAGGTPDATGLTRSAAIRTGAVTLGQSLVLTGTTIDTGAVSASVIDLTGQGALTATSLTATSGAIILSGTGDTLVTGDVVTSGANADIRIDRNGAMRFGSLRATQDLTIGSATTIDVAGSTAADRDIAITGTGAQTYGGAITAGRDAMLTGATLTPNGGITATTGALTLTATAGDLTLATVNAGTDATLIAAGTARVTGAVTLTGDYSVTGRSVALGSAGTPLTQAAGGTVAITATGGTLTGGAGLTLRSGPTGALTLATTGTTGGDIAFAGTTLATGGTTGRAAVQIRSREAGNLVTLGAVNAGSLLGAIGGAAFTTGLTRTAAITTGDVTLAGGPAGVDATLRLDAGTATLTTGMLAAPAIALNAGDIALGGITGTGAATLTGTGTLNAGGIAGLSALTIDRGGSVTLSTVTAGTIRIGQTTRPAAITTTGALVTSGAIRLASSGAQNLAGAITAGTDASLTSGGALTLGTLNAGGTATLTGAGLTATALTAGNLIATSGIDVTIGALATNIGGATLSGTGAVSIGGTASIAGDYRVDGRSVSLGGTSRAGAVVLTGTGPLDAAAMAGIASLTIDRGGSVTLAGVSASGDIRIGQTTRPAAITTTGALVTSGAIRLASSGDQNLVGAITAGTDATIASGGSLTLGTLNAGGTATLTGAGLTATALTAGDLTAISNLDLTIGALVTNIGGATLSGAGTVSIGGTASIAGDYRVSGTSVTLGGTSRASAVVLTGTGTLDAAAMTGIASLTIDRGGSVGLTSVSASGDILIGQSAAARPATIATTGALTSTTGAIRLASSGAQTLGGTIDANGAVALAGGSIAAGRIVATTGAIGVTATGTATLASASSASDTIVTAGDLARITGSVDSGADYRVTGNGVILGDGATSVAQGAAGSIRLLATTGTIAGGAGLTVASDRAGTGLGTLVLDGADGIALDPATRLLGGTGAGTGDIGLRTGSGAGIALGIVTARRLTGADNAGALTATLLASGTLDLAGTVTTTATLNASAAGTITTRRIDVTGADGDLILATTGATADLLARGPLTATRDIGLTANRDLGFTTVTAGRAAGATATTGALTGVALTGTTTARAVAAGALSLTTLAAQTGAEARGATVTLTDAGTTNGLLTLTATTGGLTATRATSTNGAVALSAAGDIALGSASAGSDLTIADARDVGGIAPATRTILSAGRDIVASARGTVRGATFTAGRNLALTAGALDLLTGSVTGGSATIGAGSAAIATLTARNATITTIGDATLGRIETSGTGGSGDLAISAGGRIDGGSGIRSILTAGRDLTLSAGGAALLGPVVAGGQTTLRTASLDLSTLTAASATITTTGGDTVAGTLTTTGALGYDAATTARIGTIDAGGAITIAGNAVDLGTVRGRDAFAATSRVSTLDIVDLSTRGPVTIRAATDARLGSVASTGGAIDIVAGGTLGATGLTATGAITGRAASATIGTTTGTTVALTATGGDLTLTDTSGTSGVSLIAARDLHAATVTAGGTGADLLLTAGGRINGGSGIRSVLATGRNLTLATGGAALLGPVVAGGQATLGTASLDLSTLTASTASITATSGDAIAGTLTTTGTLDYTASGTARIGRIDAGGMVTITGGAVDLGTVRGRDAFTATSRTSTLGIVDLSTSRNVVIRTATDAVLSRIASTGGGLDIVAGGALGATDLTALATIAGTGATATIGRATAGDIAFTTLNGALTIATLSADNNAMLIQRGTGGLGVTGSVTTGGDAILTGDGTIAAPTITAGRDLRVTTGDAARLATLTAGRAITVTAGGAAEVTGAVTAGSYTVQGGTVTLGTTGRDVTQQASGAVSLHATQGTVTGRQGLALIADNDGDGAGDLTLRATTGIGFTGGTGLFAGRDGTSAIRFAPGSGAALTLDVVRARTLLSHDDAASATRFAHDGAVTIADLLLRDGTTIVLTGPATPLTLGTARALGDLTLTTTGALAATTLNVAGALTARGGSVALVATDAGSAEIASTAGALDLTRLTVQRAASLDATGTLGFDTITAGGALGLGATGDIIGRGAATLTSTAGAVTIATREAGDAGGTIRLATITAATDLAVTGRRIALTDATATGGSATLIARGNDAVASATGLTIDRVAGRGITLSATRAAGAPASATNGTLLLGRAQARGGDLRLVADGNLAAPGDGTGTTLIASGTVAATVGRTALIATAQGGGDLTLTTGDLQLTDGIAGGTATLTTTGTARVAQVQAREATITGTTLALDRIATNAALTANAGTGGATLGTVAAGTSATIGSGGALTATSLTAGTTARLTVAGDTGIDTLTAGQDVTVTGQGNARFGTLASTAGAATLTTAGALIATTLTTARALGVAARTATIGSATAGGDVTATASAGDLSLGTLTAASAAITASGTATLGGAVTVAGSQTVRANAITLGTTGTTVAQRAGGIALTATGGAITGRGTLALTAGTGGMTLTATSSGGAIDLASTTALDSGGALAIETAGLATLGTVTNTGRTVAVGAADMALNGTVTAGTIALTNRTPANLTRLGTAPADNAAEFAGGSATRFDLSTAEIGRLTTANLIVDARDGAVRIGDVALGTGAGSTLFQIRTGGRMDVLGRFVATGSPATRTIVLGGGASTDVRARVLRVAATAGGGGRLLVDGGTLDLRADAIGVGIDLGFLDTLGVKDGTPDTNLATRYAAQSSSTLYNAALLSPLGLYTDPVTAQAGRMIVRYADFALFQNSGASGTTNGVVLGSSGQTQTLQLLATGSGGTATNAFALFGTINGIAGTGTSLLGGTALVVGDGVSRADSRANGCLIGSAGGGCLSASLAQPTLNIFDSSRLDVFRTSDDLTLPLDPLVSTSNEALFSDIADLGADAGSLNPDTPCPPDDKTCATTGQR